MIHQKRMFHTFKEARAARPFDEYPMLPPGIDPQLHLSKGDVDQPFWLVCEKDCIVVQMSGRATLHMKHSPVLFYKTKPGDFTYVPGGVPHRLEPDGECVTYRYKAEHAGREAVEWYCESCGERLGQIAWDTAGELPQEGYARACKAYNDDIDMRTCKSCGHVAPPIDLSPFRWDEIAKALRAQAEPDAVT